MANLVVRHQNGGEAVPGSTPLAFLRHPIERMRHLLQGDRFMEFAPRWPLPREALFVPDFEVKEEKDSFAFTADVPGIDEKDLEIDVRGNRLTVSGKREAEKEEKSDTYYCCERSYGSFTRSFTMPEGIDTDHIRADLNQGVLTLIVPKTAEAQAKKIAIQSAEKAKS